MPTGVKSMLEIDRHNKHPDSRCTKKSKGRDCDDVQASPPYPRLNVDGVFFFSAGLLIYFIPQDRA